MNLIKHPFDYNSNVIIKIKQDRFSDAERKCAADQQLCSFTTEVQLLLSRRLWLSELIGIRPGNIPAACIQRGLSDRNCVTVWMVSLCNGRSLPTWSALTSTRRESAGEDAPRFLQPHRVRRRLRMSRRCPARPGGHLTVSCCFVNLVQRYS